MLVQLRGNQLRKPFARIFIKGQFSNAADTVESCSLGPWVTQIFALFNGPPLDLTSLIETSARISRTFTKSDEFAVSPEGPS